MLGILIILILGIIPLVYTVNGQPADKGGIGGIGGLFDDKSDNNSNVSFVPGENMKGAKSGELRTTTGLGNELNNTIGNRTEYKNPDFDESKPIKEYDSNSSDWSRIIPIDPPRSD